MSVLIRGMEMPTTCDGCWALDDNGDYPRCRITDEQRGYNFRVREKRMDKCPLFHVPPHGRLIDADALKDAIDSTDWYHQAPSKDMVLGANSAEHQAWYKWQDINAAVYNAPTVIPADKEGEG